MTSNSEWPNPNWHIGQTKHLHALGVITSAFNQLEFALLLFFKRYIVADPKAAQKLFTLLSNYNITELIRDAVEVREAHEIVRDSSLHFLKGFEILEWNRNFLAHSHSILNNPEQPHLTFGKGSRSQLHVWSFAHMTLKEIRAVADDIHDFWLFGSHLDRWLIGRGTLIFSDGHRETVEMPDKPPLPKKLATVPHGVLENPSAP
ncbi:hypothetical protein ACVIIV_005500 [Bradyrhizobium sp. USDA 4354]